MFLIENYINLFHALLPVIISPLWQFFCEFCDPRKFVRGHVNFVIPSKIHNSIDHINSLHACGIIVYAVVVYCLFCFFKFLLIVPI